MSPELALRSMRRVSMAVIREIVQLRADQADNLCLFGVMKVGLKLTELILSVQQWIAFGNSYAEQYGIAEDAEFAQFWASLAPDVRELFDGLSVGETVRL